MLFCKLFGGTQYALIITTHYDQSGIAFFGGKCTNDFNTIKSRHMKIQKNDARLILVVVDKVIGIGIYMCLHPGTRTL